MKKKINDRVIVLRPFKNKETGKIEVLEVERPVSSCTPKDKGQAWCTECREAVSLQLDATPKHYEHKSRAGKPCSFKTTPKG